MAQWNLDLLHVRVITLLLLQETQNTMSHRSGRGLIPPDHPDRWGLLAEAEHSGVSQAQRGDGGLAAQRGLVVAMPTDAVVSVSVQVAEQRVEAAAAVLGHGLAQALQQRRPLHWQNHTQAHTHI